MMTMWKFLQLSALAIWFLIGGQVIYSTIEHKINFGMWLVHWRPMTRADITCIPPGTILIAKGEYNSGIQATELIKWCGFEDAYPTTLTGTKSP